MMSEKCVLLFFSLIVTSRDPLHTTVKGGKVRTNKGRERISIIGCCRRLSLLLLLGRTGRSVHWAATLLSLLVIFVHRRIDLFCNR